MFDNDQTIPLEDAAALAALRPEERLGVARQDTVQFLSGAEQVAPPLQDTSLSRERTTILELTHGVEPAGRPRFEERQLLGSGAMGEVVLARDNDIGRDVALKRLLPERRTPPYQAAFAGEVRTIGALDHPNIVPIYDVDVDGAGRKFVVMKHVHGETFEDVIEALRRGDAGYQKRFPIAKRVGMIVELLRAVSCAHQHGILHRDIKPANIMVGPLGEVTLMDWGIAARIDVLRASTEGGLAGTPMYMSPEQARGELSSLDERSDLFSCCSVFFELCTLEPVVAHPEQSTIQVLAQVGSGQLTELSAAWGRLAKRAHAPWGYLHVVQRGLAVEPSERYLNADELAADIQRVRAGLGQVHCPATFQVSVANMMSRFANRRPMVAMLFPLVVLGSWGVILALLVRDYLR